MPAIRDPKTSFLVPVRAAALLLAFALWMAPVMAQTTAQGAAAADPPAALPSTAMAVAPEACFPMESLSREDRELGERWLLEVMDKEGLYTIAGTLKPATLAFIAGRIGVESPTPEELRDFAQAVRILQTWRCGDLGAAVLAGTVVIQGRRVLHGVMFRRSLVRQTVRAYAAVYGGAGIEEALPAEQILATAELTPPPLRHRAWGHLLGYPDHAVDFFARADAQQRESATGNAPGPMVPRDFFSVPTFARETNHFVWAVPKGHQPNAQDLAIRDAAAPVLARYRELRAQFIGEGKPGVVALVRALLCTPAGCEAPGTAGTK